MSTENITEATGTTERKAPVENRMDDSKLLALMNQFATDGKTLTELAEATGYARDSLNQKRAEITKAIKEALATERDLTDDEIKVALPKIVIPFKRGGGGGKSTRNTAGMLASVLAKFDEAQA